MAARRQKKTHRSNPPSKQSRAARGVRISPARRRSQSSSEKNSAWPKQGGEKTHDVADLEWQPALFPPLEGLDLAHEGRREECRVRVVCAGFNPSSMETCQSTSQGLSHQNPGPRAGTLGRTERQARVEPKVEHCCGREVFSSQVTV